MKQFVLGAAFGLACAAAFYPAAHGANSPETYKALDRFAAGLQAVRKNYLSEPDDARLIDAALQGMVSSLDPHSSYMTAKAYAQAVSATNPAGVGLELTMEDGLPKIVSPIDGTPADKAGIRPGDYIAAIDGKPTQGMQLGEVVEALRGPAGSTLTLTMLRSATHAPFDIAMTRVPIRVNSVRYERKGDVGYLRIASFNGATPAETEKALRELRKQIGPALKGYVVDLRNNPGGLLDAGIRVADDFLASGNIVSTKGRNAPDSQTYDAQSGDVADGKPVIVLINEGSAAASEILAAALQDNHRATIVGMRSFGEGTVQTILPLGEGGGALRLTTSQFFRPSGKPIQVAGVTPDVAVAQTAAAPKPDLTRPKESELRGHLEGPAPAEPASIAYPPAGNKGDFQLAKALEQLGG